jgi:DNA (cytosine-5)-methyltransferase 1
MVIGENVKGLLTHENGKTLSVMIRILENLGYRTSYKVLKAQFLDVPQKRERLVIFALRHDQDSPNLFPDEKDYTVSVRAAIAGLAPSRGQEYSAEKARVMRLVPEGGYWKDLPEDEKLKFMGKSYFLGGGKTGMARRLAWDEPSLTLTCNPAQKQTERCHPEETRPLNVREYARLQCFPDDWEFSGSVSSQYRQIGNAVPVNLGYHIGLAARTMLGDAASNAELPCTLSRNPESIPDAQLPLF